MPLQPRQVLREEPIFAEEAQLPLAEDAAFALEDFAPGLAATLAEDLLPAGAPVAEEPLPESAVEGAQDHRKTDRGIGLESSGIKGLSADFRW